MLNKIREQLHRRFMGGKASERGSASVIGSIMLAFIGILVVYNLIPELVNANAVIQLDADASDLTLFAGNLGEWLLPIGAIAGIGFGVWKTASN